jgi:two-component sensor histidine kinase
MGVGETAATSLAMVVHELATNSLKYGALSSDTGTLDVTTQTDGDCISLIWMERGGPPVKAPPESEGFGSKLVRRSVSRQLGGTIDHDWSEGGLVATVQLDRSKLST